MPEVIVYTIEYLTRGIPFFYCREYVCGGCCCWVLLLGVVVGVVGYCCWVFVVWMFMVGIVVGVVQNMLLWVFMVGIVVGVVVGCCCWVLL